MHIVDALDRRVSEVITIDNVHLIADLNTQDDDGLGWSTLAGAATPERVRAGAMLLAGNSQAQAVVRIVSVYEDGQAHFAILPPSLSDWWLPSCESSVE